MSFKLGYYEGYGIISSSFADCEYGFSSAVKFFEFVTSPLVVFRVVVSQLTDGMVCVVALFDMALVSTVDIVMERILKGEGKELVGTLDLEGDCSNNGFICAP